MSERVTVSSRRGRDCLIWSNRDTISLQCVRIHFLWEGLDDKRRSVEAAASQQVVADNNTQVFFQLEEVFWKTLCFVSICLFLLQRHWFKRPKCRHRPVTTSSSTTRRSKPPPTRRTSSDDTTTSSRSSCSETHKLEKQICCQGGNSNYLFLN